MKSRIWFALLMFSLSLSLVLTACQPIPSQATATETVSAIQTEATIIIGTTESFSSFDPVNIPTSRNLENIMNINEGLLRNKPGTTEIEPALAAGMPTVSADGLTYTFTLRDGIKFGDGTDLNAKTYVLQLLRLFHSWPNCPSGSENIFQSFLVTPYVKSINAPDEKTIVFTLKKPAAYFPAILTTPTYAPANPANFPADKCVPLPPAPIYGTGPWYVSQYTVGEQVVFEPNPYYTGDLKPQVERIIVKRFADTQSLAQAIKNGTIDIVWQTVDGLVDVTLLNSLKTVSGLKISTINGGYLSFLVINHTMAPMDDPNVLKAIASAVDRNELVNEVGGGWVSPAYSQVPPGFFGQQNTFDSLYGAPNLTQAKQFLAASGYTESNPLQLTLWYPSWDQTMPLIKNQLEATGAIQVDLRLEGYWATYQNELLGGKAYTAGPIAYFLLFYDPAAWLDEYASGYYSGTNLSKIQSGPVADKAAQLIALIKQSDIEMDPTRRAELLQQVQDIYADLVVTLPLILYNAHVVYRDTIQGSDQYAVPEALNIGPTVEFNYSTLYKLP